VRRVDHRAAAQSIHRTIYCLCTETVAFEVRAARTDHRPERRPGRRGRRQQAEQVLFHIHAHLQIYVNDTQKLVPYGIGTIGPYQLAPS